MGDHRSSERVISPRSTAVCSLLGLVLAALLLTKVVMGAPLSWWLVLAPVWLPLLVTGVVSLFLDGPRHR